MEGREQEGQEPWRAVQDQEASRGSIATGRVLQKGKQKLVPHIEIHHAGRHGIIRDMPAHLLPPEAWSDGGNVRFNDDKAIRFKGHEAAFDPPTIAPYWLLQCPTARDINWLYAGLADVYSYDNGAHTRISKSAAAYSANAIDMWNGGILGGIPVINNGEDVPQMWNPISSGTNLADLSNWVATEKTRVIRPFKEFLVALNLDKNGTLYPHMVKTSHPALIGAVPSSWDETDTAKDVTEYELTDVDTSPIRDGLALKDVFVIYKGRSTWGMQWIGGQYIFRRFPMFMASGILSTHCVSALPDGMRHFVMTGDDLVVHNGQEARSVVNRFWRQYINNNMDTTNFDRSFTFINSLRTEAWFCFPLTDSTWPNVAVVWNYDTGAIGQRTLADTSFLAAGVVDDLDNTQWDQDTASWASDDDPWNREEFGPQGRDILAADPTNTKLFQFDKTNQFNGTSFTAFVERQGLALVGQDREGNPKVDFERRKLLRRIWPKATGDAISVKVGSQDVLGGTVTWETAQTFTPGTDEYLDFTTNGKLLAVHFTSAADGHWELHGYDVDIELLGL